MSSEQSSQALIPQPAAELDAVFAGVQSPDLQPPQGVEQFFTPETLVDRMKRYGNIAMHGRDVSVWHGGKRIETTKPARYDRTGYADNVASAIDRLVAETGEFPESLYDVAASATAVVNGEKRDHRYFLDDPEGVEAVGLLKAITSRPAFIKNPRAEEVLSQLGQASHHVCRGLFVDDSGRWPKMKPGYSVDSVRDFHRIATSDVLWDRSKEREIAAPLSAVATALETLAIDHPTFTQDARLDVLRKNEAADRRINEVDFHLVYSFNTDGEKAFLADAAAHDIQQATGSTAAHKVLSGYYEGVRWAI